MIGIYKISNNINKKIYVGQSINIEERFSAHKSAYERNRHPELPLYKAISKYGLENFSFDVIEECEIKELDEREKYWISALHSSINENGYNIRVGGDGMRCDNHPKHKLTRDDVEDIRKRYNNKERCKEVEKLYRDKIGHSGFCKVWKGETWQEVMPEVYTKENKSFHLHNTGQSGEENGRAKLTAEDVKNIRKAKENKQKMKDVFPQYLHKNISYRYFKQVWYGYNWSK